MIFHVRGCPQVVLVTTINGPIAVATNPDNMLGIAARSAVIPTPAHNTLDGLIGGKVSVAELVIPRVDQTGQNDLRMQSDGSAIATYGAAG